MNEFQEQDYDLRNEIMPQKPSPKTKYLAKVQVIEYLSLLEPDYEPYEITQIESLVGPELEVRIKYKAKD